ncbi:AAA family ATPase [Kitasatospora sp. NPDC056181]|uniref:AAA family ATPase n=1 Tax=Kitasatospora sp. NPDC056181 TaxID=3345737 RepID=UPI0035DE5CF7
MFEGHGPLVGRDTDLDRTGVFLEGGAGPGGLLLLLGEPGVGKTALLAAAAARAEERGMQVVATAGAEYKARLSYSGLRQFLDAAAALHPALHPGEALAVALGRQDGPVPEHGAVADAVLSVVRQLADRRRTLLAVDDVQWLDPASAVVLGEVARRLVVGGARMLCAARPGEEGFFDCSGLPVRARGQEEPLGDFLVGQTRRGQVRDLPLLLRRQHGGLGRPLGARGAAAGA